MSLPRGEIRFLSADDAQELHQALTTEGYDVVLRPVPEDREAPWRLEVTPFGDDVVAMVDVYGGWLPTDL